MIESMLSTIVSIYARHRRVWLISIILVAAILYSARLGTVPPGFYIDESSIAYNAHLIAETGQDEHGIFFPLYFKAFGEYKNPTYIYLLAGLDKIFGPSILLARGLSVALGFAATVLLGVLAARWSENDGIGILVGGLAVFQPWLFEVSRLVYEVALFPLALVLFLFWLQKATTRDRWTIFDSIRLALSLGLLTYTYSIGRIFTPLLAAGLILFISRKNFGGVLRTWIGYIVILIPLFFFLKCYPGSLTSRFYSVSYIKPDSSTLSIAPEFLKHYLSSWDLRSWLLPNFETLTKHFPGRGGILVASSILFLLGIFIIFREHRREAWWRYILYGAVISVIPAALTDSEFHTLRLIPLPIFVILLGVPALRWLIESPQWAKIKRPILAALVLASIIQAAWFQIAFHRHRPAWDHEFEVYYPMVLNAALATGEQRIYLRDRVDYPSYIHAYWYGTMRGTDLDRFRYLPDSVLPPPGALVVGTSYPCGNCRIISHVYDFYAYKYDEMEQ